MIFCDTSAFIMVVDAAQPKHALAAQKWQELVKERALVVSSSYVVAEAVSVLQARVGLQAVSDFHERIYPLLHVEWIDAPTHEAAMESLLTASRRKLSLVDCTSFIVMRRLGLSRVFAFDPHFAEQGFKVVPR